MGETLARNDFRAYCDDATMTAEAIVPPGPSPDRAIKLDSTVNGPFCARLLPGAPRETRSASTNS